MTHIRCLLLCRWRADAHCLVLWRLRDIQSEKYWQTCFPFAVTLVICSEIPTMKLPARLSRPPEARTSQVPLPGSLTVAVAYIRDTIGDRQGARGICQKKKDKTGGGIWTLSLASWVAQPWRVHEAKMLYTLHPLSVSTTTTPCVFMYTVRTPQF